jgi:hypothetical protein
MASGILSFYEYLGNIPTQFENLNSYFHMSSTVRSLFRYDTEIWSRMRQPSAAKQAEYLKTDSARILNNIFRVRLGQGHLNQKATLIRPFQFSIFPYKLCFCDISGGRTFLRSIYRFRTQLIETFSTFSLRLSA